MTLDELYKQYKNGQMSRSSFTEVLIEKLKPLVVARAREFNSRASCDTEDLIQQGYLSILENLDAYNPERGAIPSFFAPIVRGSMYQYLIKDQTNLKKDRHTIHRKIETAKTSLEEMGVPTTVENIYRLIGDSRISRRVIKNSIEDFSYSKTSMDIEKEPAAEGLYGDPEENFLRKEQTYLIESEIEKLSAIQKEILANLQYTDEKRSIKYIAEKLEISPADVKNKEQAALAALRHGELAEYFGVNDVSPHIIDSEVFFRPSILAEEFEEIIIDF